MARKRFHDPQINKDKYYSKLSHLARLLFRGLIDNADDEGFLNGEPEFLKSEIFPYDNLTLEKIQELLEEIKNIKKERPMIALFDLKNGDVLERFCWLPAWFKHQPIPDYPIPSEIANLLISKTLLHHSFNGGIHQKLRRVQGERKRGARRKSVKDRIGLGVGVGVGLGEEIKEIPQAEKDKKTFTPKEINNDQLEMVKKEWLRVFKSEPSYSQIQQLIGENYFGDALTLMVAIQSLKDKDIKTPYLYLKDVGSKVEDVRRFRKKMEQKYPIKTIGEILKG